MTDGRDRPITATIAPNTPNILYPTMIDALMASRGSYYIKPLELEKELNSIELIDPQVVNINGILFGFGKNP